MQFRFEFEFFKKYRFEFFKKFRFEFFKKISNSNPKFFFDFIDFRFEFESTALLSIHALLPRCHKSGDDALILHLFSKHCHLGKSNRNTNRILWKILSLDAICSFRENRTYEQYINITQYTQYSEKLKITSLWQGSVGAPDWFSETSVLTRAGDRNRNR